MAEVFTQADAGAKIKIDLFVILEESNSDFEQSWLVEILHGSKINWLNNLYMSVIALMFSKKMFT